MIIRDILASAGFTHIREAESAAEALKLNQIFKPDLFILDLMMPDMDGFTLCGKIRETEEFRQTPIIVQTAMGNIEERLKVFQLGANDLLTKPIHPLELVSRVKLHLDYRIAQKIIAQSQQRLNEELRVARDMQMSLFPSEEMLKQLSDSHQVVVNHFVQPSSELGGDLWGLSPIDANRLAVYMFDISGHGVDSAINAFRIHSLLNLQNLKSISPAVFLERLNKRLCNLFQPGQFATFFLGVLDTATNTMSYAVAASTTSLILRNNNDISQLEYAGFPLGVTSSADYTEHHTSFSPGDTLFLYSDALIESPCPTTNKVLSETDVGELLKTHLADKVPDANAMTLKHIHFLLTVTGLLGVGVRSHGTLADDLTMAVLARLPNAY